jgi:hypothetical protein
MAKITDGDLLVVGTEITIDTTAKTFTLLEAGNLIYKDGVTLQALYSKFIKLWETAAYNQFPFPMYAIDAKSGQFQFGTDGSSFSGWKPADDITRQALRDGGWNEYTVTGALARQYVGIVSLGEVNAGAQLYYQRDAADGPTNFTFTDEVNEGIQVFGNATADPTTTTFDKRTFFKAYAREEQKTYSSSTLADTGQTATGAYTVNVLLSNADDLNTLVADAGIAVAPYTGINVSYYSIARSIDLNDVADNFPFSIIVEGNGGTLQAIYTKVQYLLRQGTDINSAAVDSAGTKIGKVQDDLMFFVGPDLFCRQGVFVQNLDPNFLNNIYFIDDNGVARQYNYASAGNLNFNSFLTSGGTGYYRMYITDSVVGTDDYGTSTAITVNDKDGNPIAGVIDAAVKPFTFAYDTNTQGGRTLPVTSPTDDVPVTVVAGNKGIAKPVVATGVISRSKGISIALVAEQDRAYVD